MHLREKIRTSDLVTAPGALDAFSALIIQHLGFEAVYLGGNSLGLSLGKGQPFLEGRDVVDAVSRLSSLLDIPLIVDAGTGYGDPAHVRRAVRDIEAAGASALHIDDQLFPKRAHYHRGVTQLVSTREMANRLEQAVHARRSRDCMIIARSDVLRVEKPIEAHIDRLATYVACGVDGLMVLGSSLEDAKILSAEFPDVTLFWTATLAGQMPTGAEVAASPYAVALYPFHGLGAVTQGLRNVWSALKETGRPGTLDTSPHELIDFAMEVVEMPVAWEIEEQTVGPFRRGKD